MNTKFLKLFLKNFLIQKMIVTSVIFLIRTLESKTFKIHQKHLNLITLGHTVCKETQVLIRGILVYILNKGLLVPH